ncbi:hypothetical protein G7Y41_07085 [Schaalia sp. ZJ405]|uniref:hypothetical protein n=1 Tax=Schaalia sp. ZJ405 TaxID=2709403 RepID=UPI0013EB9C67|nr:hypothetical protein [Schaalia sp. ZJ405]QPK80817.1 hypothetical protein G7Y41_07085 [Schaalia sp. ZJ405]
MAWAHVNLNFQALAEMTSDLVEEKTQEVASRAGEGFIGDVVWTDRPHGAVRASTKDAAQRNARENTLLKAVQSG